MRTPSGSRPPEARMGNAEHPPASLPAPVGATERSTPEPVRARRSSLLARIPVASGVGTFLVILVVVFSIHVNGFATTTNLETILNTSGVLMIASLGQLLTVLAGGFDLSIGGVIPLAAVIFAKLTTAGHSLGVALIAVIAVGCLVGVVHLVLIGVFRINALITTLATLSITGGL